MKNNEILFQITGIHGLLFALWWEHHIPQANYVQKLKIFKNVEKLLGKTSNISQASAYRSNIVSPESRKLEVPRDFKENV